MSKHHERNEKIAANSYRVPRNTAINFVKNWLRNPKLKLSGNVQNYLLQRFIAEAAADLHNSEWSSIELPVGKALLDGIKADVRQGISLKFFDKIYEVACQVVPAELKTRKKEKRDVYGITVEKLNGFAVEVVFTINGKKADSLTVFNCGSKVGLGVASKTIGNRKVDKMVDAFLAAIEDSVISIAA